MEIDMSRKYTEHVSYDGDFGKCISCICLDGTSLSFPTDPNNMDYDYYLHWKEAGGVPTVVDETHYKTYPDFRREAYNKAGLSTEELIIALWEKVVENRPEKADAIQSQRMIIKEQYPKE